MEAVALVAGDLPAAPTAPVARLNGMRVAAAEALLAILRHGGADHYDVITLDEQSGPPEAVRAELAGRGVAVGRVQVVPPAQARQVLAARRYLALHDPGSPDLARLAAMVAPVAAEPTPCSGVAHSLSYANLVPHYLAAVLGGTRPFDALFCSSSDALAAVEHLLDHLCAQAGQGPRCWRHRLELVPLGVDVPSFTPALPPPPARGLLGLPREGRYLAYVGRLSPFDKADLDVLLRAFAALARRPGGADLRLLLAGDDSQRYSGYLGQRAQALGVGERVHLLTNLSAAAKRLALWSADIFVSPVDSVQESFGLAVVEAMAAGLPVVASAWGGYRDLVADGETGFLIPTLWGPVTSAVDTQAELGNFMADHLLLGQGVVVDEDALIERLRQVLNDAGLRAALGARGRERAGRYDWPVVVRRYEQVWRELKAAALAAGTEAVARPRFPFWEVFGHYATRRPAPGDLVEVRREAAPLPPAPLPLQYLLPQALVRQIMAALAAGPRTVAALAPSERELLALLWLAKSGAVRIRPRGEREGG